MTNSTTADIAYRASIARKRSGVTVDTLARAIGVSHSTATRRLNGTKPWRSDEFLPAADVLGVSVDYLILGTEGGQA
jgi:transcriptional regulator with XRE-family HTH domain